MAESITIKALQDASLDAKSLEEVVNGNESKQVTTRKGETYPSVKKAIKTLFENGGLPATPFATKALMTASTLANGDYAMVTDDGVVDNNSLYVKEAGAWVKSAYSVVGQIKELISQDVSQNLLEFKDVDNNSFAFFDSTGKLYLEGMSGSVQDVGISLKGSVEQDESTQLVTKTVGGEGKVVQGTDKDGVLYVNDVVTSSGSLSYLIEKNKGAKVKEVKPIGLNKRVILVDLDEFLEGELGVFAPTLVRLSPTEYYLTFEIRSTGYDHGGYIYLAGRKLTYDAENKEFTKGDIVTIARDGFTDLGERYDTLNACTTYVRTGVNKGRIYVQYNRMFYTIDPKILSYAVYSTHSDDGGVTFSEPVPFAIDAPEFTVLVFSPSHGLQLERGANAGRLVSIMYGRQGSWYAIAVYSDDGGNTWQKGTRIERAGLNESQLIEQDNGELVVLSRYDSGFNRKYRAVSKDGGATFSKPLVVDNLKGAGIKVGAVSCQNFYDESPARVVAIIPRDFSASAAGRISPHAFTSYDGGLSFPHIKKLGDGMCQYGDVAPLTYEEVLIVYGGGKYTSFAGGQVVGHIVDTEFLTGSK